MVSNSEATIKLSDKVAAWKKSGSSRPITSSTIIAIAIRERFDIIKNVMPNVMSKNLLDVLTGALFCVTTLETTVDTKLRMKEYGAADKAKEKLKSEIEFLSEYLTILQDSFGDVLNYNYAVSVIETVYSSLLNKSLN